MAAENGLHDELFDLARALLGDSWIEKFEEEWTEGEREQFAAVHRLAGAGDDEAHARIKEHVIWVESERLGPSDESDRRVRLARAGYMIEGRCGEFMIRRYIGIDLEEAFGRPANS